MDYKVLSGLNFTLLLLLSIGTSANVLYYRLKNLGLCFKI